MCRHIGPKSPKKPNAPSFGTFLWSDPLRIFWRLIYCQKLESWGYQTVYIWRPCFRFAIAHSWARTRGAQLTAGYTVNTYSKPPLYYTLGAVAPLLPTHGTHTHSGLAALCRTRTDRRTRDRHDLPTNRTAAVLPVPSCKLGNTGVWRPDGQTDVARAKTRASIASRG